MAEDRDPAFRLFRPFGSASDLVAEYLRFQGRLTKNQIDKLARRFADLGERSGVKLSPQHVFDRDLRLNKAVLRQIGNIKAECYPKPIEETLPFEILAPAMPGDLFTSAEQATGFGLPKVKADRIRGNARIEYGVHFVRGGKVHVNAWCHMTLLADGQTYAPALSSRALALDILRSEQQELDAPIVIVSDGHNGTNFAHLFFDWVPRILAFCAKMPDVARKACFVLGSRRAQIHDYLVAKLCAQHSLEERQFVFADTPRTLVTKQEIYAFSDQRERVHPMNNMHPDLLALMQRFVVGLAIEPGSVRNVYVSRADARMRGITNEPALRPHLEKRGFQIVELAKIPLEAQFSLMTGADFIVGPHGMGMSHLILSQRRPDVLEILHPERFSVAYLMAARAMGCRYEFVFGEEDDPRRLHYKIAARTLMPLITRMQKTRMQKARARTASRATGRETAPT